MRLVGAAAIAAVFGLWAPRSPAKVRRGALIIRSMAAPLLLRERIVVHVCVCLWLVLTLITSRVRIVG